MATLLLRLAGPLQSWGTASRFDERATGHAPSKSGVVGMIAAAQGRPREADISDLAGLRMGVRCDVPGSVLMDFHTAGGGALGGVPVAKGGGRRTVVTRRMYLQDAAFLVGLEGDRSLLEAINEALRAPRWPLGLGRRSCPPIPPVHAPSGPVDGELEATLRKTRSPWQTRLRSIRSGTSPTRVELIIEDAAGTETAFDQPLADSFATRVFAPRRLRRESVTIPVQEAA